MHAQPIRWSQRRSSQGPLDGKQEEPRNQCRWSNCKGHPQYIDKDYPSSKGNVDRQGQKLRENLSAAQKEPWLEGGHGETNSRDMYLDTRNDGVVTIKSESHRYRIEAHHLIPVEVMDGTSTLKKNAILAGWDINQISNGMFLPKDEADVALRLLQQHCGSHPRTYTGPVAELLKDIEKTYKKACRDQDGISLQLGLANSLALASDIVRSKIIAIRQHASGVEFWQVHSNSMQVYQRALDPWNERYERYAEQQRAWIGTHTKSGDKS